MYDQIPTAENASNVADDFIRRIGSYPSSKYSGRGIVICGGGIKYGGCAWVLIKLLRHLGFELPIEVWCLNDEEYDPYWVKLVKSFGVSCVNAAQVAKEHPHRHLNGWELKPYAILHSGFQEVLFLDADNVPIRDPSFLFDTSQYQETGTVFWPDPENFQTQPESPLWKIFGLPYRESPDQESGQLLIDKRRAWRALNLCNWYNEHSDFYYRHVYGDKETFRFAWQRLEQPISWPEKFASNDLLFTLQQHDFEDNVLFQHRFYRKWLLYGPNTHIPEFIHEDLCLEFLAELREVWRPQVHLMRHISKEDRRLMAELTGRRFLYDRPGHNRWPVQLGEDAFVEEGYGPNERFWWIERELLFFVGMDGKKKCQLQLNKDEIWEGERKNPSRMRIRLTPLKNNFATIV